MTDNSSMHAHFSEHRVEWAHWPVYVAVAAVTVIIDVKLTATTHEASMFAIVNALTESFLLHTTHQYKLSVMPIISA